MLFLKRAWLFLIRCGHLWLDLNATQMGAALSYYAFLSFAPLLLALIAIAGYAFGREAIRHEVSVNLTGLIGQNASRILIAMVEAGSRQKAAGWAASTFGFALVMFSASAVVNEILTSLHVIFHVQERDDILTIIWRRLYALLYVLAGGMLLLLAELLSVSLELVSIWFRSVLPVHPILLVLASWIQFYFFLTFVFAMIYKLFSGTKLFLRQVLPGAFFTAVLFSLGSAGIRLYLTRTSFGTVYGAGGSLLVLLVWIFYVAQIFFFGAIFTSVWTGRDKANVKTI